MEILIDPGPRNDVPSRDFFFPGPGSIQPGSLERSTSERSPFLFRKQAMRDTTVLSMHIMHVVAAVKQFTASVLLKMG